MDNQGFAASVLYRLAYGIAADRAEASRHDTLHGRRHQAKGGAAEAIEAEVLRPGRSPRAGRPGDDPRGRRRCAGRTAAAMVDWARPAQRRARRTLSGPEDLVEPARDIGRAIVSRATRGP